VNIETSCLERVSSANLVVGGSARIPLEVDDQQRLRGSFVVNEAGEYFIEADDVDDVHRAELEAHMINIDDDLYPGITLKEPISDLEVNAEDIVLLAFEAEDDFGVGGVSLVFQRAAEEQRIEIFGPQDASGLLARGAQARKNLRGEYDWGLADAGVVPGERISFYLEVEDNDNISGPKSSRSATLYLEVFSALKKHEEVLSALEDLFEKMIGQLALHLDDSLNLDEPPAGYVLKKVEHDLISKGREMMADIQSVLDMAEKDDYSGELILNSLENMIDTYKKLLALREDLARRFTRASRPGKGLKDLRQEYTEALEADIIFLDRMIKKQRLDMVVMEGKNLALAQQELAELLDKYRASKDPALLAELQRKMAELEAAVNELLDRMAKMRSEMGDEFFNVEALEGPGLKDTLDKMSLLRNALRDGDMEFALSHAEDFLNALSEMMAAMEERAGEYGEMLSMDAIRRMDDVIDRLASLESMEQGMIDRSEEMYEDQLQRMNKLDSMFESFISKESEKIDELVQKLARLQAETRNLYPRREPEGARDETIKKTREFYRDRNSMANRLRSIQRQLAQRKDELEGRELEDMLERMKNNQSSLELAQKDLEGMLEDFQAQPEESREECSSQCSKARNLGQEIIEDVEGWMERFKTALAAGDTAELKGMAYEQEDIRDQTLKAWEEIDDLAQEIPAIPLETMEKLDKASLSMRDASGYLLLEDVGKALTPEREAKAKLGQAREDLENARRQLSEMAQAGGGTPLAFGGRSGGGRSGRGSGAGGLRMDDFKIPRAGGEDEPRELREALLKAMREDSPERYRDLNHDYYERLMR
jgi:hypothetical protein